MGKLEIEARGGEKHMFTNTHDATGGRLPQSANKAGWAPGVGVGMGVGMGMGVDVAVAVDVAVGVGCGVWVWGKG